MSVASQSARDATFTPPKRVSLAEAIADSVAEAIAAGRLVSGERVVEVPLAERLNVSRVPVREALKVLHAQGILEGGSHRGFRVADFGERTATKVYETRLMLELFLLRDAVAAWRSDRGGLAVLDESVRSMDNAAKTRDGLASLKADLDFHRSIRQAAGNEVAGTLWDAIARHVLIIFGAGEFRDADLGAVVRHHKSFRDVIAGWVEAAEPPAEAAIRLALEDHLLQVVRKVRRTRSGAEGRRAA